MDVRNQRLSSKQYDDNNQQQPQSLTSSSMIIINNNNNNKSNLVSSKKNVKLNSEINFGRKFPSTKGKSTKANRRRNKKVDSHKEESDVEHVHQFHVINSSNDHTKKNSGSNQSSTNRQKKKNNFNNNRLISNYQKNCFPINWSRMGVKKMKLMPSTYINMQVIIGYHSLHKYERRSVHSFSIDFIDDWNDILYVRMFSDEEVQCPICLEGVRIAKLTSCVHIFCWGCLQRYFNSTNTTCNKCPVCSRFIYLNRVKTLKIIYNMSKENEIQLRLMYAVNGVAMPVMNTEEKKFVQFPLNDYPIADVQLIDRLPSRRLFVGTIDHLLKVENENLNDIHYLMNNHVNYEDMNELQSIIDCKCKQKELVNQLNGELDEEDCVENRRKQDNIIRTYLQYIEGKNQFNFEIIKTEENIKYFYQSIDGRSIYLSAFNYHWLFTNHEMKIEQIPLLIDGRILSKNLVFRNDRHKQLYHLNDNSPIHLIEIDMKDLLSEENFKKLERRKMERERFKLRKDENDNKRRDENEEREKKRWKNMSICYNELSMEDLEEEFDQTLMGNDDIFPSLATTTVDTPTTNMEIIRNDETVNGCHSNEADLSPLDEHQQPAKKGWDKNRCWSAMVWNENINDSNGIFPPLPTNNINTTTTTSILHEKDEEEEEDFEFHTRSLIDIDQFLEKMVISGGKNSKRTNKKNNKKKNKQQQQQQEEEGQ
ncbi:hypothetical protein SNEBB_001557 [Seison nebaliae]|nr:hypothetical protein SNEBB_001557 [Seison nebaliae]